MFFTASNNSNERIPRFFPSGKTSLIWQTKGAQTIIALGERIPYAVHRGYEIASALHLTPAEGRAAYLMCLFNPDFHSLKPYPQK